MNRFIALALLLLPLADVSAQTLPALSVTPTADGGQSYSITLQTLLVMSMLTLIPSALIMLTPFTRIIIVLAILRQGIGTAQTPNNQILIGLALFITIFIMAPVFEDIYANAVAPYNESQISGQEALNAAQLPVRNFMLDQTRENDLMLFSQLAKSGPFASPQDVPLSVLVPAFITSELKTAFQIGFLLLLPFLIIDLVVASVLMSMGMVMLSPMIISLPFKLMLFVLVDGWSLTLGTVATSFRV